MALFATLTLSLALLGLADGTPPPVPFNGTTFKTNVHITSTLDHSQFFGYLGGRPMDGNYGIFGGGDLTGHGGDFNFALCLKGITIVGNTTFCMKGNVGCAKNPYSNLLGTGYTYKDVGIPRFDGSKAFTNLTSISAGGKVYAATSRTYIFPKVDGSFVPPSSMVVGVWSPPFTLTYDFNGFSLEDPGDSFFTPPAITCAPYSTEEGDTLHSERRGFLTWSNFLSGYNTQHSR